MVNNVAVIDYTKCKGCTMCAKACPRHLITEVPVSKKVHVACANQDKGKAAMSVCTHSCIGCGLCTTKCKFDAIHLKKVRDWHAGSYETMPIKVAEGVVKRAGSIMKKAVSK